ncbi:MAG: MBL fold metallo-hydrolase [bacterium]|nr:MBL fold metallo-hydrolase [bacterium]
MTTITFLGGADTVTGSRFLVRSNGRSTLVDCGLFQGPRSVRKLNWQDPFYDVDLPESVLLTHAHIDHTGYLPRLVGTHGYRGEVRATRATTDLLSVMLPDSGRIQEEDAFYANKKGYSRHKPALPLYTEADALEAMKLMAPVGYHEWVDVPVGKARFSFAGHILGSSHITVETGGSRITFSGDVGRWDIPVLKDPEPPQDADLLLIESTYGGRSHQDPSADANEMMAQVFDKIAGTDGVLVIPAFSIGRTQEILYRIRELEETGRIPSLPVYLDSPMAIDATEVYARHHEEHDMEMKALEQTGSSPLRPRQLKFTHSIDESKKLNSMRGPMVIISASGMATAGRVPHHLKRRLPYPENIVAFVGYQAEGTRGRELLDGADRIRIHGKDIDVRSEITRLEAYSAHADEDELVRWVSEAQPKQVVLVHGEDKGRKALADRFREEFGIECHLPDRGDTLEV